MGFLSSKFRLLKYSFSYIYIYIFLKLISVYHFYILDFFIYIYIAILRTFKACRINMNVTAGKMTLGMIIFIVILFSLEALVGYGWTYKILQFYALMLFHQVFQTLVKSLQQSPMSDFAKYSLESSGKIIEIWYNQQQKIKICLHLFFYMNLLSMFFFLILHQSSSL